MLKCGQLEVRFGSQEIAQISTIHDFWAFIPTSLVKLKWC